MNSSANKFFRFCPHCGGRYRGRQCRGVLVCPHCGFHFYQNSKPTASAFFEDRQGRVLLVKRAIDPQKGWWDAPGGFLEDGEHPIHGLRREMREELGASVANTKYLGVYMDTYFHECQASTLNIIYSATINTGRLKPMDDISGVRWFAPSAIPWRRLAFRWLKPALTDWIRLKK